MLAARHTVALQETGCRGAWGSRPTIFVAEHSCLKTRPPQATEWPSACCECPSLPSIFARSPSCVRMTGLGSGPLLLFLPFFIL